MDPVWSPVQQLPAVATASSPTAVNLADCTSGTRATSLDRDVALTFVDAEQLADPATAGEAPSAQGEGPQAVLTRTLRIGGLHSSGAARVLDVIRGSSGGIVVAEWVTGSSLAEVAATSPSPIGAARAVRAFAAAAEAAHRTGGALSIDSPARIRVSTNGDAVLAFPGTLAGDDRASDVRGLGAVLYALLLDRWPLTADGTRTTTEKQSSDRVGGCRRRWPTTRGRADRTPPGPWSPSRSPRSHRAPCRATRDPHRRHRPARPRPGDRLGSADRHDAAGRLRRTADRAGTGPTTSCPHWHQDR